MRKHAMLLAALTLATAGRTQTFDGETGSSPEQSSNARTVVIQGAAKIPSAVAVPIAKCPKGAKCAGIKQSAPLFEAVVHNGFAYVEMEPLVKTAITSFGGGPGTRVARINGVKVEQAVNQIKMPYNVICVVSQTGQNTESVLTKDDIGAITLLGAVPDKNGNFAGRAFLKIALPGPVDHLDIETLVPKQATFKITTILYY
jgi:hypothetical protein